MGEVKHTAGPWVAAPYSSVVGAPVVASPNGRSIANVTYFGLGGDFQSHDDESAANARLIAAAPDLKAAAQNALEVFLTVSMYFGDGSLGRAEIDDCIGQIEAAIAKATGETE